MNFQSNFKPHHEELCLFIVKNLLAKRNSWRGCSDGSVAAAEGGDESDPNEEDGYGLEGDDGETQVPTTIYTDHHYHHHCTDHLHLQ